MDDLEMRVSTESPPVVADSSPAKVRDKQSRRRSSGMFGNKRMKGSSLSSGDGHKAVSRDHHRVIVHAAALSPNPGFDAAIEQYEGEQADRRTTIKWLYKMNRP